MSNGFSLPRKNASNSAGARTAGGGAGASAAGSGGINSLGIELDLLAGHKGVLFIFQGVSCARVRMQTQPAFAHQLPQAIVKLSDGQSLWPRDLDEEFRKRAH